ncbi:MAG: hypothetical protein HY055_09995 [Magnetospirillum sp.]|nr:hypothetical protein [Magnetospirillum sp.]
MTFEFAPDWIETLLQATPYSPAGFGLPVASAPAHPNAAEVAALVGELFAEGTLSPEQFQTLLTAPELKPYIDTTSQMPRLKP